MAVQGDGGHIVPQSKDFISIRLDEALKAELQAAAEMERRSLSSFGRLLLEYAWTQYLKAGSIRALISHAAVK
jgi:predicted transcriptional regulator